MIFYEIVYNFLPLGISWNGNNSLDSTPFLQKRNELPVPQEMPKYIELLYGGHSSSTENDGYEVPRTNLQKHGSVVVNGDIPQNPLSEKNYISKKGSEKPSEFADKDPPECSSKIKSTTNANSINASDC